MSNSVSVAKKGAKTSNCVFSRDENIYILDNMHQFFLAVEQEAGLRLDGLTETKEFILKQVYEKYENINNILSIRFTNPNYHVTHGINVCLFSLLIGFKMGLKYADLRELTLCGLVHDVGKLKIPIPILLKSEKLTAKEEELIRLHVPIGYKMAKDEILLGKLVSRVILEHHESYNGEGYPRRLSGQDLHIFSQIIAVADTFEKEFYLNQKPVSLIVKEILKISSRFNPQVLYSFVHML